MIKIISFKKSQSLLYVGFALLAVAIVAAVVMTAIVSNLRTADYKQKGKYAFHLAMAGIERAKVELTNDWSWVGMDIGADNYPNLGKADDETISLGGGRYWVTIYDNGDGTLTVTSHGWVADTHRYVSCVLTRSGEAPRPAEVWVADRVNRRAVLLDNGGNELLSVDLPNFQPMFQPWSVATNPSGECWVAEYIGNRVTKLNANGTFAWSTGTGVLSLPYSVAVNNAGESWVAEHGAGGRVTKLRANGTVAWRSTDSNINIDFIRPTSIAVNPVNGESWVADYLGNRVTKLNANGTFAWSTGTGVLSLPYSIAVNPITGEFWVAEVGAGGRVTKLDANGVYVWRAAGFQDPRSVAVSVGATGGGSIMVLPGSWRGR